jgi:hypothetical protein
MKMDTSSSPWRYNTTARHAPKRQVCGLRWRKLVRAAQWASTDEVQKAAPKAKVLNRESEPPDPLDGG